MSVVETVWGLGRKENEGHLWWENYTGEGVYTFYD